MVCEGDLSAVAKKMWVGDEGVADFCVSIGKLRLGMPESFVSLRPKT